MYYFPEARGHGEVALLVGPEARPPHRHLRQGCQAFGRYLCLLYHKLDLPLLRPSARGLEY
jgi:hypothetical protein